MYIWIYLTAIPFPRNKTGNDAVGHAIDIEEG